METLKNAHLLAVLFYCCHCVLSSVDYNESRTHNDEMSHWSQTQLSREQLLLLLTRPGRYDRHQRPLAGQQPVHVTARVHIYLMQSVETHAHQKLRLNVRLSLGFLDQRLNHSGLQELRGEAELMQHLWTPHVFLANERHSSHLGLGSHKDVLVRVLPSGQVFLTTRMSLIVICSLKRGQFPFDELDCPIMWESWLDNSDDLELEWGWDPVTTTEDVSLNSFKLRGMRTETLLKQRYSYEKPTAGRFGGRFWAIQLTFSLARAQIFFIMDHYVPSVLLVMISWVTFWIEPDSVPARVLLGSSTMLTFITLAVRTDALPVSYVKASEIWFVGCCTFIFGSLVEFAFVNTIWRQGQSVEVKKVNTRHILRSTLGTPRAPRRLLPQERYMRRRTSSLGDAHPMDSSHSSYYHTIHSGAIRGSPLAQVSEMAIELQQLPQQPGGSGDVGTPRSAFLEVPAVDTPRPAPTGRRQSISEGLQAGLRGAKRIATSFRPGFTRMSAQEVATWIDRRSRVAFPVAFLAFNCFYWAFVCLV